MTEKKMTTGGFFRGLLRHVLTGGASESPIAHVIQKGLEHGIKEANEEAGIIETTGEESETHRDSDHEGAGSKACAPKAR